MRLRNTLKINSVIVFFLIFSLLGNNTTVMASEGHDETEIDISSGYTSEVQTLEWNEVSIFEFEVAEAINFTFEINNIIGAIDYYSFNHEGEEVTSAINLLDGSETGDVVVEEGETLNHDNLPVGSHIEVDVLRYLKIIEVGNYTLTFSNGHEHEADDLQFKFKFSAGLSGDETFGTAEEISEDAAPGFGLAFSFVALFAILFLRQKFQKSK